MNNLFSCFEITITPTGYRATCGQSHPWCGQLAPSAVGCVIFRPMDWWSWCGTVHRKYTGLPRRIDRNEYYFALLYIVRQVTIPYSALQFRWNFPVFWCFEIPRMPGHKVACRACVRFPMYSGLRGCKHRASLWFTENIRLPMWILSIAISIIDLNVYRWSTTKLMQVNSHESRSVASDGLTKCIQTMVSLNTYKNSANKFGRKTRADKLKMG